jgi:hypothetical protein
MSGSPHDRMRQLAHMRRRIASRCTPQRCLMVVLLCLITGCTVAPMSVEREDDLITLLGRRAVQEEMTDVLARTYDPPAKTVQFKPDRLTIIFSLENVDKTYLEDAQERLDLIYRQVKTLASYTNGRVFVDRIDGPSAQLNFRHPDDAETFTKLFYVLKTHAAS